jgi:mono/diheme cytochrome c family protein
LGNPWGSGCPRGAAWREDTAFARRRDATSAGDQPCKNPPPRLGQGGAYNGPAPVLAKTEMPFDGFKGQLCQPAQDMPAYSEAVMSDQQIADIDAFVQSLPSRRDPKSIAILND